MPNTSNWIEGQVTYAFTGGRKMGNYKTLTVDSNAYVRVKPPNKDNVGKSKDYLLVECGGKIGYLPKKYIKLSKNDLARMKSKENKVKAQLQAQQAKNEKIALEKKKKLKEKEMQKKKYLIEQNKKNNPTKAKKPKFSLLQKKKNNSNNKNDKNNNNNNNKNNNKFDWQRHKNILHQKKITWQFLHKGSNYRGGAGSTYMTLTDLAEMDLSIQDAVKNGTIALYGGTNRNWVSKNNGEMCTDGLVSKDKAQANAHKDIEYRYNNKNKSGFSDINNNNDDGDGGGELKKNQKKKSKWFTLKKKLFGNNKNSSNNSAKNNKNKNKNTDNNNIKLVVTSSDDNSGNKNNNTRKNNNINKENNTNKNSIVASNKNNNNKNPIIASTDTASQHSKRQEIGSDEVNKNKAIDAKIGTSGNCDKKNTSNSSSNNGKKKQSSGSKKLQIDTANTNANATYNSANADHNNKKNNWDIIKTSVKKKTWRQKFGLPFMLIATLIPGIGKKKFKTRLVRVQSDENIKKGPGSPTNSSSKWMAHSPLSSFRRRRKEASERYLMHGWEQARQHGGRANFSVRKRRAKIASTTGAVANNDGGLKSGFPVNK